MEDEIEIITLTDEDGKETRFEYLLTISYDNALYAAVHPMDDPEEGSVYFLKMIKTEEDEDILEAVDNEILSAELFDEFMNLLDEMDEEDGSGGEE